jgi:hypothetical protein
MTTGVKEEHSAATRGAVVNGCPLTCVPAEVEYDFLFHGHRCELIDAQGTLSLLWFVRFAGVVPPETRRAVGATLGSSAPDTLRAVVDNGQFDGFTGLRRDRRPDVRRRRRRRLVRTDPGKLTNGG